MSLSRLEQETIVNYNEDEDYAEVYTASPVTMRKMDKLCERFPDTYQRVKRNSEQATYHCPKTSIDFKKPRSAAQIAAARAAVAKMRSGNPLGRDVLQT